MNVLLVDDHPLFAVGFVHALTHAGAGVHARTAATIDEGLALAKDWPALDIVLVDFRLAAEDGIAGLRVFGATYPLVARVLISCEESAALAAQARAAGASGFLGKSVSIDDMVRALQSISVGGVHFEVVGAGARVEVASGQIARPTARQMEVLRLIALGRQNKRIADELGIVERTVKLHVTALFAALGARNRTHLLAVAREKGLL